MYQPIIDALRRGAADEALTAARAAVAAQPQAPAALHLLAAAQRQGGDRAAALATIEQAIALAPDDADLHLERAGLLLQERQLDAAQSALARSIGLDPNQFPAYIAQAQLALSRGDLDEAQRLSRTAARIAPHHPHIAALEGTLALRRGEPDHALALLTAACSEFPDEPQLRRALGFAYLAKEHFAFAEQAFRSLLEHEPDSRALRIVIANLVRQQGRPGEAADELALLLEQPGATPALLRRVGELELEAGRVAQALPRLRAAAAAGGVPDRRLLGALFEAWRQLGDGDDARATLDGLLAEHRQLADLWVTRLRVESFASAEARAVVEQWHAAMPDFVPANEALLTILDAAGETVRAEATALHILALAPGHPRAELRVIDGLLLRDPEAARVRIEDLLARAREPDDRYRLQQALGRVLDLTGQFAAAAALWTRLHQERLDRRMPLPAPATLSAPWPALATAPATAPPVRLLWGAPGSLVERIALAFGTGGPLRADRFSPQPPADPLQQPDTAAALAAGRLDGAELVAQWRAALPTRGVTSSEVIAQGEVFDWLRWWDNALLLALRPHLPEAVLLVALRDPRDMLLEWLAHGSPGRFALASPLVGAQWLAQVLGQVADLHEQDLFPHRLLRLDEAADTPAVLAAIIADAFGVNAAPATGLGGARPFGAGHWRAFAEPLAEAFAVLAPVAQRLGYPAG